MIPLDELLRRARALAMKGEDDAAKEVYVDVLRADPSHFAALNELGVLARASGHRSAARTAFTRSVLVHPRNPVGHVNLGNLLLEEGDPEAARPCFEAALAHYPDFPEAHQGLARALTETGETAAADSHWRAGFHAHAVVTRPYRGTGPGIPLLLLVSARNGNMRTETWINDRRFALTAIFAEFFDPSQPLPPHQLVVNAIGDADLCEPALRRAEEMVGRTAAPVINHPARVRMTGRLNNARRLSKVPDVIAPEVRLLGRAELLNASGLHFPLLVRAPGHHTGKHFAYVRDRAELPDVIATMPGEALLAIQYVDARGPDGNARKYRVMFVDGVLYPLHLAISANWKVHYFTADMASNESHREEERRFLDDMHAVLGERAVSALEGIRTVLGLDYAGIDFALAPDGSVILFEANATMVVVPPGPEPVWQYRRRASDAVLEAVTRMFSRRAEAGYPRPLPSTQNHWSESQDVPVPSLSGLTGPSVATR